MTRLSRHNIKINEDKCKFNQPSVQYLGYQVTGEGIKTIPQKVELILASEVPNSTRKLMSYLGVLQYYHRFLPNLSSVTKHLYNIVKKKKFEWSQEAQQAFEDTKKLLNKSKILMPFNPELATVVATDASPHALGAVLLQIHNGEERPVQFASCTLSSSEQNYSQLEKEALAIIYGVKKFHKFLYGRKFKLITDHKPLKWIFAPDKAIPNMAAARIQRWALTLSSHQYEIEYRKGEEMLIPDFLSRYVISEDKAPTFIIKSFNEIEEVPINYKQVAQETENDSVLCRVTEYLQSGWQQDTVIAELKPFWEKRFELTIEQNCILWGRRVIIPNNMKKIVLKLLHDQHTGMTRMKMLARSVCWWPNQDKDIEQYVKSCSPCALNQPNKKKEFKSWETATKPFKRCHIDFFSLYQNTFFILVDSYSKWIEVKLMKKTQAKDVLREMDKIQANFGLFKTIVADNGPPFASKEFEKALKIDGITLLHSPPYTPESNGLGERAVQTVKKSLKKSLKDVSGIEDIQTKINKFLLKYRNTPTTTTGKTPAELIFAYKPITPLDLLKPPFTSNVEVKPNQPEFIPLQIFVEGEKVLVKLRRDRDETIPTKILKSIGAHTYLVEVKGSTKLVHTNQLRKSYLDTNLHHSQESQINRKSLDPTPLIETSYENQSNSRIQERTEINENPEIIQEETHTQQRDLEDLPTLRRSTRIRKQTERYAT